MKLKLLNCLLLMFFCFIPAILAQQPNDLNMEGLTGKVKRIDEDVADIKIKNGAAKETSRRRARTVIFDKDGRVTYEWLRIGNLSPFEQNYSYEKNYTRRIRRTTRIDLFGTNPKPPPDSFSLSVFRYEADKNTIFQDVYIGDGRDYDTLTQQYKYVFGKDNRLLEKFMLTPQGGSILRDKYIYDAPRLPTGRELFAGGDPNPQVIKYSYELDARGNWTKQTEEKTIGVKRDEKQTEVRYRKISYY